MVQRVAWVLFGAGVLALAGWGIWGLLTEDEIPGWVRVAVGAIAVGTVLIAGYVLRDRIKDAKTDRYKEVRW